MNHRATPDFWKLYKSLPADIQGRARKAYEQLKADPRHPSLHFGPLKRYPQAWYARATLDYRAVAILTGDTYLWFWIGSHAEFDRMFSRG